MKINLDNIRPTAPDGEIRVGDMFTSKNHRVTSYWLVAAVRGSSVHVLGLDRHGGIVATATYGVHAMRERPLVGRVEGLSDITLTAHNADI